MWTPWGDLRTLDLKNPDTCARIVFSDKHQLLEGLVVERLFDKLVDGIKQTTDLPINILDIETAICAPRIPGGSYISFVLARSIDVDVANFFDALEECTIPHLVEYVEGTLVCSRICNRQRVADPIPLHLYIQTEFGAPIVDFNVDESVRDEGRQREAFWDFLLKYYKDEIGMKVALPRVFLNAGIQPFFSRIWNLDRLISVNGKLWLMEVEHKFPIESAAGLKFGLNAGELNVISRLEKVGISCLHTILVKPIWDKDIGSMYLLTDDNAKKKAAFVSTILDRGLIDWLVQSGSLVSGAHTSITGTGTLQYKTIPLEVFSEIGVLSNKLDYLSGRLFQVMQGAYGEATSEWLKSLRING